MQTAIPRPCRAPSSACRGALSDLFVADNIVSFGGLRLRLNLRHRYNTTLRVDYRGIFLIPPSAGRSLGLVGMFCLHGRLLDLRPLVQCAVLYGVAEQTEPGVQHHEARSPGRYPLPGRRVPALHEGRLPDPTGTEARGQESKRGERFPLLVVLVCGGVVGVHCVLGHSGDVILER